MASPPFSLTTTAPADTDIASVFPALDRSDKDVIQSWIESVLNSYGRMQQAPLDGVGTTYGLVSAPSPSAGTSTIYRAASGLIELIDGETSTIQALQVPPGTILDYAGASLPNGYLLCYGQAVSRSTYAALFAALSTTWGSGDGSTTFNLPDLRGRAAFGKDDMGGTAAGRISATFTGTTLGASGGAEQATITQAQLPSCTFAVTITDPGHHHVLGAAGSGAGSIQGGISAGPQATGIVTSTSTTGITASAASGGSGTAVNTISPGAIVNKIIKY